MDNITQINNQLNGNQTVLNSQLPDKNSVTAINSEVAVQNVIAEGTFFLEKYQVIRKLDISTGEADLYLCTCNGKEVVLKMYRRTAAVKPEVVSVLKKIDSPYVAKLYESDTYNGLPFEVLPYYKNGSLQGRKYSYDELRSNIIPSIAKGLKALHDAGIIHKDLKPSNIMLNDDEKSIAIIDFGISSVHESGNTVLVTKTGMTPEYSAPETFKNLFLEESDYYSFGITIFELFFGYTPYANMSGEQIAQYTTVQGVPLPNDMPNDLRDLISALTYYDITKRNEKSNPNRRWTYEEVEKWCRGEAQVIPGNGMIGAAANIPAYTFMGNKYTNINELVNALALDWDNGKKQLFRGLISGFFKNFNPEIAGFCLDAEDEAANTSGKDDFIFCKLLYKINPDMTAMLWKGRSYESLSALGREVLEKLWNNDESDYKFYNEILSEHILSEYLNMVATQNTDIIAAVKNIESQFNLEKNDKRSRDMVYYTLGYMFSGQKLFCISGKRFASVKELTDYMKQLLDNSYDEFTSFCHKLIGYDSVLDTQFEAWLIALGKRSEIENWRRKI